MKAVHILKFVKRTLQSERNLVFRLSIKDFLMAGQALYPDESHM